MHFTYSSLREAECSSPGCMTLLSNISSYGVIELVASTTLTNFFGSMLLTLADVYFPLALVVIIRATAPKIWI